MAKLSTLGVTFGYGIETSAGVKPTTFKQMPECESIGGITLETEQIDVSSLEDYVTEYTAGRQDTGGTWEITFHMDPDESVPNIQTLYSESTTAKSSGLSTWFQVQFPDMDDAFFVVAETGREIPLPDIAGNEAAIMSISLIISEYKGLDTKVTWTTSG